MTLFSTWYHSRSQARSHGRPGSTDVGVSLVSKIVAALLHISQKTCITSPACMLPCASALIEQASDGACLYHLKVSVLRDPLVLHATASFSVHARCRSHEVTSDCNSVNTVTKPQWEGEMGVTGSWGCRSVLEAIVDIGKSYRTFQCCERSIAM